MQVLLDVGTIDYRKIFPDLQNSNKLKVECASGMLVVALRPPLSEANRELLKHAQQITVTMSSNIFNRLYVRLCTTIRHNPFDRPKSRSPFYSRRQPIYDQDVMGWAFINIERFMKKQPGVMAAMNTGNEIYVQRVCLHVLFVVLRLCSNFEVQRVHDVCAIVVCSFETFRSARPRWAVYTYVSMNKHRWRKTKCFYFSATR